MLADVNIVNGGILKKTLESESEIGVIKMKLTLVRPTLELKEKALEYRQEHFDNNETIINGSELLDKTESYEEWLQSVTNNTSPDTVNPNWVVTDTFFAVDENENIIGIIDFRHTLNDFLKDFGNNEIVNLCVYSKILISYNMES